MKPELLVQHLLSSDEFRIGAEDAKLAIEDAERASKAWADFVWIPGVDHEGTGTEIGLRAARVLWVADERNSGKSWAEYVKTVPKAVRDSSE